MILDLNAVICWLYLARSFKGLMTAVLVALFGNFNSESYWSRRHLCRRNIGQTAAICNLNWKYDAQSSYGTEFAPVVFHPLPSETFKFWHWRINQISPHTSMSGIYWQMRDDVRSFHSLSQWINDALSDALLFELRVVYGRLQCDAGGMGYLPTHLLRV